MHGTGQITKDNWNTESRRLVRCGRRYFVVSPGSIPLNLVSWDVVFTLQKRLFIQTAVSGRI